MQATVSEVGFAGLPFRPHLGRVLTGSIGTDGVVPTSASEVKFSREEELLRKHSTRMSSLIKNESVGIEDDQIPS